MFVMFQYFILVNGYCESDTPIVSELSYVPKKIKLMPYSSMQILNQIQVELWRNEFLISHVSQIQIDCLKKTNCSKFDSNCFQFSNSNCEVCDGGYLLDNNSYFKIKCMDPNFEKCKNPDLCLWCKMGFKFINF